jgi:serine phosphatase RsbU (regulator of sigma subunit)/catechol 2,3-dioxygenase-like lactoylglutathione lyase family enzyme
LTRSSYNLSMSSIPPAAPHLRIHSINIYVRDQDRSLRFYLDQLGFHLAYDAKLQSGERMVAVAPPDGTAVLSLIVPKPDTQEYKLIGRASRLVFITDDVLAKFQEWSKRGVKFQFMPRLRRIKYDAQNLLVRPAESAHLLGEETPIWGGVFTRFRDPDGNTFALVSFDEVTHALEAQRKATAAKLEAERRAAQELEIAKEVQARLFPQTLPAMGALDYCGACYPARAVGGDYYDFLELGLDRLGLVIGDISGKGIAAALLMANLQANLRSQCLLSIDEPVRLLKAVNHLFCQNTPDGAFATLFFADYQIALGRLRYANCGHLPALVLRSSGRIDRLEATCTVLGVFRKWECQIGELGISPGDTLVLYTDGITEAFDEAGDEFGEERLTQSLLRHRRLEAKSLVAAVVDEVRTFSRAREQHDDITMIVVKCGSAA